MTKNLVKTVLIMDDIDSEHSESKENLIMLIRRETEKGSVYERLNLSEENKVKKVSNQMLTANQYILLIEKYFDAQGNKAYCCEEKKQEKKK